MDGITSQGFVYEDRYVAKIPQAPFTTEYLRDVISQRTSTELQSTDTVWEVVEFQLVGLLMHDHPVVYDKHLLTGDDQGDEPPVTRKPDGFESKSLENLQAGAERVMGWNEKENCLQVLGAIRAKAECLKCHDVRRGSLLGAFSYRITEATLP